MSRLILVLLVIVAFGSMTRMRAETEGFPYESALVGPQADDSVMTPVSEVLTPAGIEVQLPRMRPQAVALSPDGKLLVTSGKSAELVVVSPEDGKIIERVPLPGKESEPSSDPTSARILKPDAKAQLSYTGLIFSPDGSRIYLSDVNGTIKVFSVDGDRKVRGVRSMTLPPSNAPRRKVEIPAGLALSADGKKLYVVLNLSNRLLEMDAETGKTIRIFDVGFAPYDVRLAGNKAYVSNWGGRRPDADSLTGPAGRGMEVRVDPVRHIASEGSVSVIDLEEGKVKAEILTGLHASGLALSGSGRYLCVANAGSDTMSVIDTRKDRIVETISLRWHPNDFYGASPNALMFGAKDDRLYVCNGTQNAIAAVRFRAGKSKLEGLIPTGWYPGALAMDGARKTLYVANIKGTLQGGVKGEAGTTKFNSHQYLGTINIIPVPDAKTLGEHTQRVLKNYRHAVVQQAKLPARAGRAPQPVPERVGEPSVFKHVIYIIKENRTYDQVLGDVKEGNGDPQLCVFGERETPNQHKMTREFVLLDNAYCSGILSADGHQWADSAFATDYMEKSFADFPRSYPDGMDEDGVDAMVYSPAGFIWDNAIAHGKTLRDYGEYTIGHSAWKDATTSGRRGPRFLDYYRDFMDGTGLINLGCEPGVASLGPHIMTNTIGWHLSIPDVYRAAQFIRELRQFEAAGKLPELMIICLPNDHTSGTRAGQPTPAAQVADNDLAFGRIVEAVSHSAFWKDTCIFAIEDDPQAGWDHVSGYRTTAYVVSAYCKRHSVVSVNYNQPGMLRTMELMLGLPPMNQMDASATPMFACFQGTPDLTPFDSVTNNVPLDQMNPRPEAIRDPMQQRYALASARLPLEEPDRCPEDLLNHIIWRAQMGTRAPYPSWAITVKDDDGD